ncbi:Probable enoyl-CoA hydratase echA6 [Chromobacterium violaceum]|uniref:Probable enoyl-CoA hydratase echA6 n=1 Tax=Chromobacterium violaceum TaxID=536 RepID=A0A3S4JW20_CHRVL|nr:Probable enoyl-CoA hydratase echA6 [Chromobacterium violaceum]
MSYTTLQIEQTGKVATVWLNRPELHNALNEVLIAELTEAMRQLNRNEAVRVIVLAGRGKSFCAGADLDWMRRAAGYSEAENLADAQKLAAMLKGVYRSAKR